MYLRKKIRFLRTQYLNSIGENNYENIYFNLNPDFKNGYNNELFILQNSEAINLGNSQQALLFPLDILNTNRVDSPDLGAYQHIIIND